MVQIIFFVVVLFLFSIFGALIFDSKNFGEIVDDIGYPVILSVYFLGIMLLIANFVSSIINRKGWTIGFLTIVTIIYFIGWIEDFSSRPFSTILFLLVGLATIYLKFLGDKIRGMIKG